MLLVTACQPGALLPIAGTGTAGSSGDGGPATAATFRQPGGVLAVPEGGFYVVDGGACVIRHVDAAGTISTVAGNGTCGYSGDHGPATAAAINPKYSLFSAPSGQLALDAAGDLYLADSGNGVVRRIGSDGVITTVAGPGNPLGSTCSGTDAAAGGITITPDGTVYLACANGIGKLLPDRTVQKVYSGNPVALTSSPAGDLYFSLYQTGQVWKRTPGGTTTLVADLGASSTTEITGLAFGPDGTLFGSLGLIGEITNVGGVPVVTYVSGNRIVQFRNGTGTVIAGTGDTDPGTLQGGDAAKLALSPGGIAATPSGNLIVSSGHAVYRLVVGPNECNPSVFHPGADLSGQDLSHKNLMGCDLSGINLTGADFTGSSLNGAHGSGIVGVPTHLPAGRVIASGYLFGPGLALTGTTLQGIDLSGVDLTGAEFSNVTLSNVDLSNATLKGMVFVNANLVGTNLTGADLAGVDLSYSRLSNTNMANVTAPHSSFAHAILRGTSLTGADLSTADFTQLSATSSTGTPAALPAGWVLRNGILAGPSVALTGVNLSGVDLSGVDLGSADLSNATGAGVNLAGATLRYSELHGAKLVDVNVSGTDFAYARLQGGPTANPSRPEWPGVNLSGVTGVPVNLPSGVSIRDGYLVGSGISLAGDDLSGADLSNIVFTEADFTGAVLHATDITNANFSTANFSGVRGDAITTVPLNLPISWAIRSGFLVGDKANLSGFDLAGVNFTFVGLFNVNLTGANLAGSNFAGTFSNSVDFTNADLAGADLTGATLSYPKLGGAHLATATFTSVMASGVVGTPASLPPLWVVRGDTTNGRGVLAGPGTRLIGLYINGIDLSGIDLHGASFRNTQAIGVSLAGSNLTGADFTGTDLSQADLTNATFTNAVLASAKLGGANLTNTVALGVTGNPSGGATATYVNTTCPSGVVVSSPGTCVGHGFSN